MAMPAIHFDDIMVSGAYAPPLQYEYKLVPKASPITWTFDPKADLTMPDFEIEMVKVPVGKPYIDKGAHRYRIPGVGCTREMVSALAGERWTDQPRTADDRLTISMIRVNDALPDLDRQKMLEFVPRLLGTNITSLDWELDQLLQNHWREIYSGSFYGGNIEELFRSTHSLLDQFDRRLGRPKQELDQQVLTRLMTALAA